MIHLYLVGANLEHPPLFFSAGICTDYVNICKIYLNYIYTNMSFLMDTDMMNKYYVTTPIYYVTAQPHLGSLYSTVLADVVARWSKLYGKKVFFLTGTDEHGQKILQSATKAGKDPKTFVDSFVPSYQDLWQAYHIDYTYFIRTTDPDHAKSVQYWIEHLLKTGDIYTSVYQGWYCTPCETYLTDKEAEQNTASPLCSSCNRETTWLSEESYFFRLSAYQDRLLKLYQEHPDFIVPKSRIQEVIAFVKEGLRDLSISRTTISWGISFPGDPKHTVYVWADALNNYISAIGYGDPARKKEFETWWPADLHILGKDIVRFHAIFWPAFLMAAGLEMPKRLLVHGWIKMGEQKMSKSLGNVIDPHLLRAKYGADEVRYYLMRHIAVTQDSSFSTTELEQCITADLANGLGNLLNRVITLANKHDFVIVHAPSVWSEQSVHLRDTAWSTIDAVKKTMEDAMFHMAVAHIAQFTHTVNAYVHNQEPWKLATSDRKKFEEVISAASHSIHRILLLLWPIMPKKMELLLQSIGKIYEHDVDYSHFLNEEGWHTTYTLGKPQVFFKKYEETQELIIKNKKIMIEENNMKITIDDFVKVELRVGTIVECQIISESEKLYKLQVHFGPIGNRQILSGVRKFLTTDQLIGKQAVFVTNLQPRKMVGYESDGMLLTAKNAEGSLYIISPTLTVPDGTQLS
jgi:methionyl-tRNA synthetase